MTGGGGLLARSARQRSTRRYPLDNVFGSIRAAAWPARDLPETTPTPAGHNALVERVR